LHHGRQRWCGEARGRNIVETGHRNVVGHGESILLECTERADRDQIARRNDCVEFQLPSDQSPSRLVARLLGCDRVDLQLRYHTGARILERRDVAAMALEELRIVARGVAQKRYVTPAESENVAGNRVAAAEVIAAN